MILVIADRYDPSLIDTLDQLYTRDIFNYY